jgi:ESCRT-II complex subunit VPS22
MEVLFQYRRWLGFLPRRTNEHESRTMWKYQSKHQRIGYANDRDDIVRSISALAPLGPGVSVVTLPSGARYIRSIPKELNPDQAVVLEVAGVMGGCVSVGLLKVNLAWEEERGKSVMEELVAEGMVWVDDGGNEREYWIPRGITEL